ncbi:MAG: YihA family ribosome biogenesis GTP-binding protein [Gammaproteobacteria bacterium]|nr:MAG: YihA family ribosome biogenesis GTP-binding protein [Gammaproteobacteria bacterium]
MSIDFSRAKFVKGAHHIGQCMLDMGHEVAFAGRSNAGKSSALNVITGVNNLARTSKQPGRTQQINFFELGHHNRLVDLPGYGFAKVPPKLRQHWDQVLSEYFETRQSLAGLIVIMDARHPLKELDLQLIDWVSALDIPVHCLLTKCDKLKKGPASSTLQRVRRKLEHRGGQITVQLFSALNRQGVDLVRMKLNDWFSGHESGLASDVTEEAQTTLYK